MKKSFVKFVALALVLIMVLGAVPVSAASKTIENAGSLLNDMFGWLFMPIPQGSAFPEQEFLPPEVDGVTVTVRAPEGALPAGTDIEVAPVDMAAVQNAVDASSEVSGTVLAAVDITFRYRGEEIQPTAPVTVTMTSAALEGQDNLTVVHIDDLRAFGDPELIAADYEEDTVTFDAQHFSVYAVLPGSSSEIKFLTINFFDKDGETLINKQKIRIDRIPEMDPIVYDPGVPSLTSTQAFTGWGTTVPGATYTTGNSITVDDINDYVEANYGNWDTDQELTYIAQVFSVTYVFYTDQYGAVFKTDVVAVGGDFVYDNSYVPAGPAGSIVGLVGWVRYNDFTYVNKVGDGNELPEYNSGAAAEAAAHVPGEHDTANGELILFPYIAEGHWITFDNNITDNDTTRATFTAPKFVAGGSTAAKPADPTRDGYTFDGWYTDKNCTTPFKFEGESGAAVVDSNITLYAKWTGKTSHYTVVVWVQDANDTLDSNQINGNTDYNNEYDYKDMSGVSGYSSTVDADAGSPVTTIPTTYTELGGTTSRTLGYYFIYNEAKTTQKLNENGGTTVKGDGTTVVNVYYDRRVITFNFYNSSTVISSYKMQGLYNAPIPAGTWPTTLPSGTACAWSYKSTSTSAGVYPFMVQYNDPESTSSATVNWYAYTSSSTGYTAYYVCEKLDGSGYDLNNIVAQATTESNNLWTPTETVPGFTLAQMSTNGTTWSSANPSTQYTLTANTYFGFARNRHSITFLSDGETLTASDLYSNPSSHDITAIPYEKPLSAYRPDKDAANGERGKYFTGWYKNPECTELFDWTDTMPDNDIVVYAGWENEFYRIVFEATDSGTVPATSIIVPGENQSLSFCIEFGKKIDGSSLSQLDTAVPGYTFGGWFYDAAHTIPFSFDTEIGPDIPDELHSRMDMSYADLPDSQRTGTYVKNDYDPTTHMITGSTTVTWSDASTPEYDNSGVRGKLTLYGLWRKKVTGASGISVIYNAIEGKGIIKSPYPAEVVKPDPYLYTDGAIAFGRYAATPIDLEGADDTERQFLYWEIRDEEGNVLYKVYPGQPFPINIDWAQESESYTITWNYKDASGNDTSDTTKVAEGMIPTHPTPASYQTGTINNVFDHWEPELAPAEADATYTAVYRQTEISRYTVTFIDGQSSSTIETQQVIEGAYTNAPAAPSHSGYNFIGWTMNDGTELMTTAEVNSQAITADTTFTAQYTVSGYTVTFDANTGSFGSSTTTVIENVPAGTRLVDLFPTTPPTHSTSGWNFYGWFTQSTGGTEITSASTATVEGNVTLYAHWFAWTYVVDTTGAFAAGDRYAFVHSYNSTDYFMANTTNGSDLTRVAVAGSVPNTASWIAVADTEYEGYFYFRSVNSTNYYFGVDSNYTTKYCISTSSSDERESLTLTSAGNSQYYLQWDKTRFVHYTGSYYTITTDQDTPFTVYHRTMVDQNAASGKSVDSHNVLAAGFVEQESIDSKTPYEIAGYDVKKGFENRSEEIPVETKGTITIDDTLTRALIGVTDTSYSTWTGKTDQSDAVYAGNSAGGNSSIQLRSRNSTSGIVSTASGGKIRKITVVWNSNTANGGTLDIYGKNTAYSAASDLYSTSTRGTKLGSIVYGTSTELAVTSDYEYIGIRSNSGALYLTSITITWETEGYTVNFMANGELTDTMTVKSGNYAYLPTSATAVDGYDFIGWTTGTVSETTTIPDFYAPGDLSPAITADTTFYALYRRGDGSIENVFQRVSSSQSDWVGKYVISYNDDASYVLMGSSVDGTLEAATYAKTLAQAGITRDDDILRNVDDLYIFAATHVPEAGYESYYFLLNKSTHGIPCLYKANSSSSSQLYNYVNGLSTSSLWLPTYESTNGNVKLENYGANSSFTDYPYISFDSNNNLFWAGTAAGTNTSKIYLWKETVIATGTNYFTTEPVVKHTLTINYVYENGTQAAQSYTAQLDNGETYSVNSPAITGYTPDQAVVSGTMGTEDVTVTVTYSPIPANTYTVTYKSNGATISTDTAAEGATITLPATAPAQTGYDFIGWVTTSIPTETTTTPSYYAPGASYGPVNDDVTFHALYMRGEGTTETVFELLTAVPENVPGTYVISSGTAASNYMLSTRRSGTLESASYTTLISGSGATISVENGRTIMRNVPADNQFAFAAGSESGYYTIVNNSGSYLYIADPSSTSAYYLAARTSYTDTYSLWGLEYTDGVFHVGSYSNSDRVFHYSSASLFGLYSVSGNTSTVGVQLWKQVEISEGDTYYTTQTGDTHKLTITYTVPDGFTAPETYVVDVPVGQDYSVESPAVEGLIPDRAVVTGTMGDSDVNVTVVYTAKVKHTVTVTYVGPDDGEFTGGYQIVEVYEGDEFAVIAPEVPGYEADTYVVEGVMGDHDLEFTVTYHKVDVGDKTYTITLYAVYGRVNTTGDTHINWYTNDNTANENSGGARQEDILGINDPVNIPTPTNFVSGRIDHTGRNSSVFEATGFNWDDHVFLGWARVEDPTNTDVTGHAHRELNEGDLYLWWDGSKYQVETKNGWVDVEQVAADELRPYHDMYAVWADVFYVYHSSNNKVDRVVRTTKAGTYDLTANLANNTLYGGYYTDYSGKSTDFAAKDLNWNAVTATDLVANNSQVEEKGKDDSGSGKVAYNGEAKNCWDWTYAVTEEKGNAITPEAGATYYIKEVPAEKYLRDYLHYTYYLGTGTIASVFLISDIDDLNYNETGFIVTVHGKVDGTKVVKSLTISPANGTPVTLKPDELFSVGDTTNTDNRLTYVKVFDENNPDASIVNIANGFSVSRYWKTPDGLYVSGVAPTAYKGNTAFDINYKPSTGAVAASVISDDITDLITALSQIPTIGG